MLKMLLLLLAKDQKKPSRQPITGELATSHSYTVAGPGWLRREGEGQHIRAPAQPQHRPAAGPERSGPAIAAVAAAARVRP